MQGFKFIHTADLHLDSPFQGIRRLGAEMRQRLVDATFQAFQNLVELAISEEVDFLLIAGDLFDNGEMSLQAQLFCHQQFRKLTEAGIQVYLAHGNHDHLGGWRADLDWPEGVFIFPAGEVATYSVWREGEELAQISGISYPKRHVDENYLGRFRKEATQALYQIGLLHTNVGKIAGYDNYAPCTLSELVETGFDYWALGHVHTYQVLHPADPLVIYPGTPQGRHPGEVGAKGCCLVEVASDGHTSHQWVAVDQLRWLHLEMEIREVSHLEELITAVGESLLELAEELAGRDGIVRVFLQGRGPIHPQLRRPGVVEDLEEALRSELQEVAGEGPQLWVESIRVETQPDLDLDEFRAEESLFGDFLKLTQRAQEKDPELMADLEASLAPFLHDRRLKKYLGDLDSKRWQRLIEKSEELGVQLFGLEVEEE